MCSSEAGWPWCVAAQAAGRGRSADQPAVRACMGVEAATETRRAHLRQQQALPLLRLLRRKVHRPAGVNAGYQRAEAVAQHAHAVHQHDGHHEGAWVMLGPCYEGRFPGAWGPWSISLEQGLEPGLPHSIHHPWLCEAQVRDRVCDSAFVISRAGGLGMRAMVSGVGV